MATNKIQKFSDLIAWQEGHKLVIGIYEHTKNFPSEEKFSLTSQVRRSAISITSNLAEGFGRQSIKDKIHFYIMARGSVLELQNQLLISRDIRLINRTTFEGLVGKSVVVHKLINGLIRGVRNNET